MGSELLGAGFSIVFALIWLGAFIYMWYAHVKGK